MSVIEKERAEVLASGSSLAKHNLNQRAIKRGRQGVEKTEPPRKAQRAEGKHERRLQAIAEYEHQKQDRILGRIGRVLEGYDNINRQCLGSEIRFIICCGITVEN